MRKREQACISDAPSCEQIHRGPQYCLCGTVTDDQCWRGGDKVRRSLVLRAASTNSGPIAEVCCQSPAFGLVSARCSRPARGAACRVYLHVVDFLEASCLKKYHSALLAAKDSHRSTTNSSLNECTSVLAEDLGLRGEGLFELFDALICADRVGIRVFWACGRGGGTGTGGRRELFEQIYATDCFLRFKRATLSCNTCQSRSCRQLQIESRSNRVFSTDPHFSCRRWRGSPMCCTFPQTAARLLLEVIRNHSSGL